MSGVTGVVERGVALTNALGVPSHAEHHAGVVEEAQIAPLLQHARQQKLAVQVLGGATNVVLPVNLPGLVLSIRLRGIELRRERDAAVLEIAAGENWHSLVRYCLGQGLAGLENLSLIPGTVGAAPVQNIGAYGVEVGDFLEGLNAIDLVSGQEHYFARDACALGYRKSRFREEPDAWCITRIRLRLPANSELNLSYQGLAEELDRFGVVNPQAVDVAEAVMRIRRRKLPDPRSHPNAGSFFKNPVIGPEQFARLQADHGTLPAWSETDGRVKLSAAALIDRAGWKRRGTSQLHVWRSQPLVIVNEGAANGPAVLRFAAEIAADIYQRFGVTLEAEPLTFGKAAQSGGSPLAKPVSP